MTQYYWSVSLIEDGGLMPVGISFFAPQEKIQEEIHRRAMLLFGSGVNYEVVSIQGECKAPPVSLFRGRTEEQER